MDRLKEVRQRTRGKAVTTQRVRRREVQKEGAGTAVGLTGLVSAPSKVEGKEG